MGRRRKYTETAIHPGWGRFVNELIAIQRRDNGRPWVVQDMADALELEQGTVRAWLTGTVPRIETLVRMADVVDVPLTDLVMASQEARLTAKSARILAMTYERTLGLGSDDSGGLEATAAPAVKTGRA